MKRKKVAAFVMAADMCMEENTGFIRICSR